MVLRRLGYIAVVVLVVAVAGDAIVALAPRDTPRASHDTAGYPRLANYNGLRYAWQAPFFSAYGLVIARRGAPVRQLKQANPTVTALLYERTLQSDLCCVRSQSR